MLEALRCDPYIALRSSDFPLLQCPRVAAATVRLLLW
jgi:hypothetical protein